MNSLQAFLHGIARAFTVPHTDREKINEELIKNPHALAALNAAKDNLVISIIHASAGQHADPLTAALAAAATAQQIERMIPTPANVAPPSDPPAALVAPQSVESIHINPPTVHIDLPAPPEIPPTP